MKILRLIGKVNGGRSRHDGGYVVAYDPTILPGGVVILETTRNPQNAMRFKDAAMALEYWRAVSPNKPVREDGKPNRPLTAFTAEILDAPP